MAELRLRRIRPGYYVLGTRSKLGGWIRRIGAAAWEWRLGGSWIGGCEATLAGARAALAYYVRLAKRKVPRG